MVFVLGLEEESSKFQQTEPLGISDSWFAWHQAPAYHQHCHCSCPLSSLPMWNVTSRTREMNNRCPLG